MTPFPSWLDDQYHRMAAEYRAALAAVVRTAHEYAEGNIWEARHTAACVELLRRIPRPTIAKYSDPTDEDREHLKQALRPDWGAILQTAILTLPDVQPVNKV